MLTRSALMVLLLATPAAAQTSIDVTMPGGPGGEPWPQAVRACLGALVAELSTTPITTVEMVDAEVQPGSLSDLVLLSTRLEANAGKTDLAAACIITKSGGRVDALTGINIGPGLRPSPTSSLPPDCSDCDPAAGASSADAPG